MNDKGKSVRISEGVRLYKQLKSRFWWLAYAEDGNQKKASTKVPIDSDPEAKYAARDKAIEMATEIRMQFKLGVDLSSSPTFSAVADKTIEHLESLTPRKEVYTSYIRAINRYLKPYFNRKPIVKVNRFEITKFYQWREGEAGTEISKTQRNVTNKALKHIFNYACDYGYIEQYQIPDLPNVIPKHVVRRDFFTEDQLEQVLGRFAGFIDASRNFKTKEIRQNLECYVSFLYGSGARPGKEVLSMRFGDIAVIKKPATPLWVATIKKGKTVGRKGERQIVLGDRSVDALRMRIKLSDKYKGLELHEVIRKYPRDYLFAVSYRDSLPEYGRPFTDYMEYLGWEGKGYTLYCIRHTYITHRLLGENVPRRAIAKQCGTSEEMIEEFYDHVISLDYADELKKGDRFNSVGQHTLEELFQ